MSTPALDLRDVRKTYHTPAGHVHALGGVTAQVPAGAFCGIVGRSGSGKSTLLHLLAAMDQPTSGTVRVGGVDVGALGRKEQARFRRERVGMVFQQFNLVASMDARANVELPLLLAGAKPDARRRRAAECLDSVGLSGRATHRPAELSGGEQQRVAIARALAADPDVLLCDEPTGNLDSETAGQIVDLLRILNRDLGKTVVVVTHHFGEIQHACTHRLRLSDGLLVEEEAYA
jgi:ABC-type lipoprotein export system ATPase subunit